MTDLAWLNKWLLVLISMCDGSFLISRMIWFFFSPFGRKKFFANLQMRNSRSGRYSRAFVWKKREEVVQNALSIWKKSFFFNYVEVAWSGSFFFFFSKRFGWKCSVNNFSFHFFHRPCVVFLCHLYSSTVSHFSSPTFFFFFFLSHVADGKQNKKKYVLSPRKISKKSKSLGNDGGWRG